jgi:hypothetical protein
VLDADIFDTVPFSVCTTEKRKTFGAVLIILSLQASFSAFLNFTPQDDTTPTPADIAPDPVKDPKRLSNQAEASYYVEVCALCSGHSER